MFDRYDVKQWLGLYALERRWLRWRRRGYCRRGDHGAIAVCGELPGRDGIWEYAECVFCHKAFDEVYLGPNIQEDAP